MNFCGSGGNRTSIFFSAMDKNAGIEGVSTYITANNSTITNATTTLTHAPHCSSYLLLNYHEKILFKNPSMYGTFVPIHSGHLPIDFYQRMKYNLFKQ
jgi:hypothetical protein